MITCLHGMSPRRHHPPGATYELAKTVQTTGATSDLGPTRNRKVDPLMPLRHAIIEDVRILLPLFMTQSCSSRRCRV